MHDEDKNVNPVSDEIDMTDEEFSLESILAEFKGTAYIDGDKKTPSEILDERARRIILEANEGGLSDTELYAGEDKPEDFFADIRGDEPAAAPQQAAAEDKLPRAEEPHEDIGPDILTDAFKKPEPPREPETWEIRDNEGDGETVFPDTVSEDDIIASAESAANAAQEVSNGAFDEAAEAAAVGSFVDEVLAKEAEEETLREAGVTEEDVRFFDTFTYADLHSGDLAESGTSEAEGAPAAKAPGIPAAPMPHERDLASQDADDRRHRIIDFRKRVSAAVEEQDEEEERQSRTREKLSGILAALRRSRLMSDEYDEPDAPDPEEPDYMLAARELAARSKKLTLRADIALAVAIVMAACTVLYAKTGSLFGFLADIHAFTAALILLQLVVMLLSFEIIVRGAVSFAKGGPGAEGLIVFACLVSYIAAFHYIRRGDIESGVPFCAIPAFSAAFALWAEKLQLRAMSDALRTAVSTTYPNGVMTGYSEEIDRILVKKYPGMTKGFYNNLVQADNAEMAYRYFAPILIFASLLLSVITSIGGGRAQYFWHFFSAMSASVAVFSSILAFVFPFYRVTRRARKSGAAIAGWSGADAIYFSDGVRVTDDDLFPDGTLSLSGVKIFEDVRPEKAIMYTSSLIIASGSGLSRLFSDLLEKQGLSMVRVDDFDCYEGGVGALIRGERVLVGSAAFMNLMGIRVPQTLNLKNAVFSAVNDTLIAVFAVNYVPVGTVQSALVSLLRTKTKLYFAVRDFNITPLMLQQKFKVPVNDVEHLPVHDTYAISSENERTTGRAEAVLCREGLGPLAEAVTGAKRLRTFSMISVIISVVSAIVGLILVFLMCWQGGYSSVSPVTLLVYMLAMLAAVLLTGCLSSAGK